MSRSLRVLFPGAIYHVTTRGNRRVRIYVDDKDHLVWQDTLGEVVKRFHVKIHAFCLMPNHYHVLIETPEPNLPQAKHLLNGSYARRYNKRHSHVGHLFQDRYHAVLVERQSQLLEALRYIALNPLRAGLAACASNWPWSHDRYICRLAPAPEWLMTGWALSCFAGDNAETRIRAYRAFVAAGIGLPDPIARHSQRNNRRIALLGSPRPLEEYAFMAGTRELAMAHAFASGAYTREQIAHFFKVSRRTVSRAIGAHKPVTAQPVSTFVPDPEVDTNTAIHGASSVGINARKVV